MNSEWNNKIFTKTHQILSHSFALYADDKQVYTEVPPHDIARARSVLVPCIHDISSWCSSRRLQLNEGKTELIWFGSRHTLQNINRNDLNLQVGSTTIEPVRVVRDLGVLLDDELSMKQHISKVASSCFFQLRRLRQLRRLLGQQVTAQLVSALILSRLDYCNSVLAGLPATRLEPLQRVQNAAARLVFARDSIYAIARICDRNSVCLNVCLSHGWIVQKRLKLGSCNLHHRVAPWL